MKSQLSAAAAIVLCASIQAGPPPGQSVCVCQFVAPIYSPIARLSRTQGVVRVRVSVDPDGIPGDVELLSADGTPNVGMLVRRATEAVGKWRFCSTAGDKTKSVVVTFRFKVNVDPTVRYGDEWSPTEVKFEPPANVEITTTATTIRAD
jgi:TonB family protein